MAKVAYSGKLKETAQVLAGAVLLCLPALYAGRPQPFSDSKAYYVLGQATVATLTGHANDVASAGASLHAPTASPDSILDGQDTATSIRLAYTVAASRSPYWSALFYLAASFGTAWLVVGCQAIVAAVVLWIGLRGFAADRAFLPIVVLLALASSLPVEVMFLMPDLFAGLVILSATVIAFRQPGLRRWEVGCLWAVMAGGALFHTSHLMVLAALGLMLVPIGLLRRGWAPDPAVLAHRPTWRATGLILSAAAVGLVGAVGYPLAVRAVRHEPVYAPPFLSARLIADGPGRAELRRDCRSGDVWGWCRYLGRPMTDANVILWSTKPATASFQAADYDQRVRLICEQPAFVARTMASYPAQVMKNTALNVGRLMLDYGTFETLDDRTALFRDPDFAVLTRIVQGAAACARSGDCRLALDIGALDRRIGILLLASLVCIVVVLLDPRRRRQFLGPLAFVFIACCLNALVCGSLSGDAQRYQSRITWLIPLMAMILLSRLVLERVDGGSFKAPAVGSGPRRQDVFQSLPRQNHRSGSILCQFDTLVLTNRDQDAAARLLTQNGLVYRELSPTTWSATRRSTSTQGELS